MSAADFIRAQLDSGRLTADHIEELVRSWQEERELAVDGLPGPRTLASIERAAALRQLELATGITTWPLRLLADGRRPAITSGFRTKDRPGHDGVDLFYPYLDTDPPVAAGDGGAVVKRGDRRWWIPPGTCAVAAGAGRVLQAGRLSTGLRLWIDHGHGLRTGYFHLATLLVSDGDQVEAGQALGLVGDNPRAHDATHLHFEVSPTNHYAPRDPRPFLERAGAMLALG